MGIFRRGNDDDATQVREDGLLDDSGFEDGLVGRGALDLAGIISPDSFIVEQDHIKVGDEYQRTLYVIDYPPEARPNFLWPLFRSPEAMDVTLHITPLESKFIIDRLRQKIARDEARLVKAAEDGYQIDHYVERRYEDNRALIRALEQDRTRPFQFALMVTLKAKSLADLDRMTSQFEQEMTMVTMRRANLRHRDGFISTMPLLENRLHDTYSTRNIHTHGLQTIFPFTSADLSHEEGVLYGVNMSTNGNVIINRFRQPEVTNPGMAVLGTSGSGKSYFAKAEMLRWAMLGVPVIVIDPQNEYDRLCAGIGGQFIDIAVDSNDKINPLDFSYAVSERQNALARKIAFMVEMIQVMLRAGRQDTEPLTDYQRSILEEALRFLYQRYGYTTRSIESQLKATPELMPTLSDLHTVLEQMRRSRREEHFQQAVVKLTVGLRPYVGDGSLSGLFDHLSTVDLRSDFIVFNVQSLGDDLLPVGMHLVLEFLRTSLFTPEQQTSGRNRLLYVDEAQRLMAFPETAQFLEYTARTARKFGIGFTVLTQDVEVFLINPDGTDNRFGIGILQNCATTMLLRQHRNALEAVQRVFKLTDSERMFLSQATAGEGMFFMEDERAWISGKNVTSPLEHQMITTTTHEVAQIRQQQLESGDADQDDRYI